MDILYLLIPLSVVLVFAIAVLFWWAVKAGQFDDLEGPAYRMLMDDERFIPGNRESINSRLVDSSQGRGSSE